MTLVAAPSTATKGLSMGRSFGIQGYAPHDVQREFHKARKAARFRLADAGRRTGKSNMGGHELAFEAMRMPGRIRAGELGQGPSLSGTGRRAEYWIVGPEYSDAEKEFRVLYDTLIKMNADFDRPGTYYSPAGGALSISMYDGKFQVHTKSAKLPTTLVGEALEGVIFAEASKIKPIVWPKFIRPMLADYRGWAMFTSTPEGKNWFYDIYKQGLDPAQTDYYAIKAPSWSNNILFPGGRNDPEILSMENGMSPEKFKQEIGAEFTEFVGRVYKQFDDEVNVGDYLYNPKLPIYMCADYGYTNPNVVLWVQVDVWDNVYVIAEYYRRGRRSDEMVYDIQHDERLMALTRVSHRLYGDPEDPGATDIMCEKFGLEKGKNTGGLLKSRIDLIRKWLMPQPLELEDGHPEKLPKLFFDRSCTETTREMQDYRYPETKDEAKRSEAESPMKLDDHGPEALSRFFGGYYHEEKPKRRARVSQASFGR